MQEVKQFVGDCIIYAAALEAPLGEGFVAATLVVAQDQPIVVEVFRDDRLEDGLVWRDPIEAVRFATRVGTAAASLYAARVIEPVMQSGTTQFRVRSSTPGSMPSSYPGI